MSEETIVVTAADNEDNEPIYFTPKLVSLVSNVASILSWIVLVGFLGDVILQGINLQTQIASQGLTLSPLLSEVSFLAYLLVNLIVPLLTGLGLFVILQAAAMGLNILLEMDFNARESRNAAKRS